MFTPIPQQHGLAFGCTVPRRTPLFCQASIAPHSTDCRELRAVLAPPFRHRTERTMDARSIGDQLFHGLGDEHELSGELRARLMANVEGLMAATGRSAARGTLEADVVLVAAGEHGEEERVRASSRVLQQTSTGFGGLLLNCGSHQEIRLLSGCGDELHPIAAVRWVMEVVHAVAACDAVGIATCSPPGASAPAPALKSNPSCPSPKLTILVAACQIADCWDCQAVLNAAAQCLSEATRLEEDFQVKVVSLVRLLRLVPREPPISHCWLALRRAVESALAREIPVNRLASVLKNFDLEQMARVVNLLEDEVVELKPLHLKGPTSLERGWQHRLKSHPVWSEQTTRSPEGRPRPTWSGYPPEGRRTSWQESRRPQRSEIFENHDEAKASIRCAFSLSVHLVDPPEASVKEAAKMEERFRELLGEQLPEAQVMNEVTVNMVKAHRSERLAVYLCNSEGVASLICKETSLWVQEEGGEKSIRNLSGVAISAGTNWGFSNWALDRMPEDMGSVTIGGTVHISRLQRQFEVLARWQDANGVQRIHCPSRIVGCVKRLQLDALNIEVKVRLSPSRGSPYSPFALQLSVGSEDRAYSNSNADSQELCTSMMVRAPTAHNCPHAHICL